MTPEPWERLADALLAREGALCRIVSGVPPRDFAGLYVGQDQLDGLLHTLPGLDGPTPTQVQPVRDAFASLIASAREGLTIWLQSDPSGAFARCIRSAALTGEEAEVLALLAAVDMHPARQRLVAYVQDSVQLPRLTLATLSRIFGGSHPADRALAPAGRLQRAELVTVEEGMPWAVRMCGLPSRVSWALRGDASPDPDLPAGSRTAPPLNGGSTSLAPPPGGTRPLALVHGADIDSRVRAARSINEDLGCLIAPLPATNAQWAAVVREAGVSGLAVALQLEGPAPPEAVDRAESASHVPWVWCSAAELPLGCLPQRPWREVRVEDAEATDVEWLVAFGVPPPSGIHLTREQLRHVAAATGGQPAALTQGVRRLAGGHLDSVAVRVRPQRSWSDLVLPPDQTQQLREIAVRHRRRGTVYGGWGFPTLPSTGVVALFAGPSGTGKTLAAEVLAAELGLDLYKVELSSVVSKWIGETEKNLGRIFDAAQARELVLFFDEADALFGKRSEVSDAHDRYANIEVAYLLQRLETYDGIVVLATNLQRNIDPAFLRRISVAVEFCVPNQAQRRMIWQHAFPEQAPVAGLDLDFLARQFKVSGGVIHNAALAAAFLAADAEEAITMDRVARALDREYQKMGRLRTEAEFADYYGAVVREPRT